MDLEILEDRCLLSGGFTQVNLASNVPGLAAVTDPNLVNPWGISASPTGPFWFADNGSGVSDVVDGRGQIVPLVVTVPATAGQPSGAPAGTVFNPGTGFVVTAKGVSQASLFLFAGLDGTISGWAPQVDPTNALVAVDNAAAGAVYTGLAFAADPAGHGFLYAADFGRGTIDVFDQDFNSVTRPGAFQDANLPAGFAPFNIQKIDDLLYVAYAPQDSVPDGPGAVNGIIDVYAPDGALVSHFASGGALYSPWGLAQAPAGFGPFGGALLVGNNGDGHINAYDPHSGAFLGQLADDTGNPITIPNLWALTFGNDHEGGASSTLFFAAGINDQDGLFGAIQSPQGSGADTSGAGVYDPTFPGERADYPLPPMRGPALQPAGADQPLATSVLLPLSESSLALVPTLSTVSQPGSRTEASRPASPAATSLNASVATALFASGTIFALPAGDNYQPPSGTATNMLALNTLFDVNPSQNPPEQAVRGQEPVVDLEAAGGRTLPTGREASVDGVRLAALQVGQRGPQARADEGPDSSPRPPEAATVLVGVPAEGPAPAPDVRTAAAVDVEGPRHRGWTHLVRSLLLVVCTPAAWCLVQGRRNRSRQGTREQTRSNEVTTCLDPIP